MEKHTKVTKSNYKSAEKDDFYLVDEVCGIGEYISAAEEADISIVL